MLFMSESFKNQYYNIKLRNSDTPHIHIVEYKTKSCSTQMFYGDPGVMYRMKRLKNANSFNDIFHNIFTQALHSIQFIFNILFAQLWCLVGYILLLLKKSEVFQSCDLGKQSTSPFLGTFFFGNRCVGCLRADTFLLKSHIKDIYNKFNHAALLYLVPATVTLYKSSTTYEVITPADQPPHHRFLIFKENALWISLFQNRMFC